MMTTTYRLMQSNGVSGPRQTIEVDAGQIEQTGREWAMGQTGHPWDHLTAEYTDAEGRMRTVEIER